MSGAELMVDIETLGTTDDAVILSIGSVIFDPDTGDIIAEFYTNVDPASQPRRRISPDTIMWWMKNSDEARAAVTEPGALLVDALAAWERWLSRWNNHEEPLLIWAKSPSFDVAILRHAAMDVLGRFPFGFRQERDVRTVEDALKRFVDDYQVVEPGHHALDDAKSQVGTVCDFYFHLLTGMVK